MPPIPAGNYQAPPPPPPPAKPQRPDGRATADEINARVVAVDRMLARRLTRTQIHQEAAKLWGCGWQTADRYMLRARENALRTLGQTRESARALAIAFNNLVIQSRDAEVRDKLVANKDNNELLGLYPPKAVRLKGSGPDGDALTIITVIAESPIDPGK